MPLTLILASLLAAGPTCGPVDLDTAMALGTAQSDEVAIKRAEVAAAEADRAIAGAARWFPVSSATVLTGPVPEAHGTVTNPITSSRTLLGIGPFGRIDISVVQPIYTWGRLDAASAAAAAGIEARTLLLQDTTSAIQLRVTQMFWGIQLARRLLALAADVEKLLPDVEKKVEDALNEGSAGVAPADRYKVRLYRSMVRRRKAEAEKGRELAHSALAATMGVSPDRFGVQEVPLPQPSIEVPDVASAVASAKAQRPDLAALDQAIAARAQEVKAARAAQLPQIFVGGMFAYSYAPNRDIQLNPWAGDYFNALAFGVSLGFRQDLAFPMLHAQVEKASAERAKLERQRDGLARLIEVQVEGAVAELRATSERFQALTNSSQISKQWFRSAWLDFEAGVADAKDVLEAYAISIENQVDTATAQYDLILARAKFDQVIGTAPVRPQASCELR